MTVEELIVRLQELPDNLEIRVNRPNNYGGSEPQSARSADLEYDDPQDDNSPQFVLIQ